jgi:hypothetical protein
VVYLIDIQGNVTHMWTMPYPPGLYGYLTDRGTLFYNGKIPNEHVHRQVPIYGRRRDGGGLNGKVLWEIEQPDHHHDGRRCATATSCCCAPPSFRQISPGE